jgi:hypothetical protein
MSVPSSYLTNFLLVGVPYYLSSKLLSIFFLSPSFSVFIYSISPSLFCLTFSLTLPFINFLLISLSSPFLLCPYLNLSDLTYVSISSLKVVSNKNQGGLKVRLLGCWSRTLVLGIVFFFRHLVSTYLYFRSLQLN